MLTEVKQHLRLLRRYFSFNLQSSMEYKTNFLVQSFGMALNNLAFVFFWWVLFTRMNNQIGGYHFEQLMTIWAIGSCGFGISQVAFGNTMHLTQLIVDGQLDSYMLQPKNLLWNILISRSSIMGWGDVFFGVILFVVATRVTFFKLALFLLFVLLACFVFSAVMVLAHTLTFYLGRSSALGQLLPDFVVTLSIYPEGIFGGLTRFLLYTLLPAGFISYIPVRLLTAFDWRHFVVLLFFDLIFVLLACWFFERGVKQYESGNLVQSRV